MSRQHAVMLPRTGGGHAITAVAEMLPLPLLLMTMVVLTCPSEFTASVTDFPINLNFSQSWFTSFARRNLFSTPSISIEENFHSTPGGRVLRSESLAPLCLVAHWGTLTSDTVQAAWSVLSGSFLGQVWVKFILISFVWITKWLAKSA